MDESTESSGVITIILARMGSTRLPGKVLLPLGEVTVLEQVIRRVRAAGVGELLVAIPAGDADRPLARFCWAHGIRFIAGHEDDIMCRLGDAARELDARWIVRCQASSPLLDPKMLAASLQYVRESGMDLVTVGGLPQGVACDAFSLRTLTNLRRLSGAVRSDGRAHGLLDTLTTSFERAMLPAPPRLRRPNLRLSLETEDDYWFLKRLYDEVPPREDGLIAVEDVIRYIEAAPDLLLHGTDGIAVVNTA